MAEFLVFNKEHWMDSLSQAEIDVFEADYIGWTERKYNPRYQKGDVIEIHEDGFWTDGRRKGFGANVGFALITIPGMSLLDAKKYTDIYMNGNVIQKCRRYQMDMTKIPLADNKKVLTNIEDAFITDKSI